MAKHQKGAIPNVQSMIVHILCAYETGGNFSEVSFSKTVFCVYDLSCDILTVETIGFRSVLFTPKELYSHLHSRYSWFLFISLCSLKTLKKKRRIGRRERSQCSIQLLPQKYFLLFDFLVLFFIFYYTFLGTTRSTSILSSSNS